MPVTPLHATALLFMYFRDRRRIDPLALAISTTFIDLEPLYYILLGETPDHRVWHGFMLALTVYPILVTVGIFMAEQLFEDMLWTVYKWAELNPIKVKYPILNIYLLSFLGGFSHIFLDVFTHREMFWVLYPFAYGNPLYNWQAAIIVEAIVIMLSVYSVWCWVKSRWKVFNLGSRRILSLIVKDV